MADTVFKKQMLCHYIGTFHHGEVLELQGLDHQVHLLYNA